MHVTQITVDSTFFLHTTYLKKYFKIMLIKNKIYYEPPCHHSSHRHAPLLVFDAICLNPIPECQNVKSSKNLTGNLQYATIVSKLLLLQGSLAWFNAMIIK
jgi:hypothetical protein